ncbi:hypothetical protein KFU94_36765 [Chloroflexi bacterium TSY]|nr:hypothetical protein [Chloroflexi bacterium TSY]
MMNNINYRTQVTFILVGLLTLLLLAALLWSNGSPSGLFGTAVNTTGIVVESSECGARRNDVCVELDFNHEIVIADSNGHQVVLGNRVQAQVQDDLSRATILSVIGS